MNTRSENRELMTLPKAADIPALFENGGADPILARIKEEVDKFEPDLSTVTGRKAIASMAFKVARSKTTLDDLGKKLGEDIRGKLKTIDNERKKIKDKLDALKNDVRKPLDEWEEKEKKRIEGIKARISDLRNFVGAITAENPFPDSSLLKKKLAELNDIEIYESFGELAPEAGNAKASAVTQVEARLSIVEAEEKRKAEDERKKGIQAKIDDIKRLPLNYVNSCQEALETALKDAEAIVITEGGYQEFVEEAAEAKREAISKLKEMHSATVKKEEADWERAEDEKRLVKEREDLEKDKQDFKTKKEEVETPVSEEPKEEEKTAGFRGGTPLSLEVERRQETIAALALLLRGEGIENQLISERIYGAIERGEIPHVRLDGQSSEASLDY